MRPLRAILFDIDDTLYSTTDFASKARRAAVEAMVRVGLRTKPEDALRELGETIAEFGSNYEHHYDKLLDRLPPPAMRGINRAVVIAAGVAAYHDAKFTMLHPFPDVLPALRALALSPLIRGVVTDGLAVKQAEKLIRLGVYPYLTPSAVFISDQLGVAKPNPKIFHRACDELALRPEEVMVVGDHPQKDIDPAAAVGCVTVLARRGGRHGAAPGRRKPDFSVRTFKQLLTVLARVYKVPLSR
jgi:putative hydrolase of the HAD superfamily